MPSELGLETAKIPRRPRDSPDEQAELSSRLVKAF